MLTSKGGVIDDLIVYYMTEDFFRLVAYWLLGSVTFSPFGVH